MVVERGRRAVLHVEDSDEQFLATTRAFREVGVLVPFHRCRDGEDALDYLHRRGAYAPPADAPRPAVILLDLDMPGVDGRELIVRLKEDPALASIPVVVISISENPHDVRHCYANGAAGYVVVRPGYAGLVKTAAAIRDYWFDVVALPEP